MSPGPPLAALLFLVAAVLVADGGDPRRRVARALAALGTLALLVPTVAPLPIVALAAAATASSGALACVVASVGALAALTPAPAPSLEVLAAVLAALALAAVVASFEGEEESFFPLGHDAAWPSVAAGLLFSIAAARYGDGQILRLSFSSLDEASACTSPGAGRVLGLSLLVTLAGTVALSAHLLTPATPSAPVRRLGGSALALGSVLAVLGVGTALVQCGPGHGPALAAGPFLLLAFAAAALPVATAPLLRSGEPTAPRTSDPRGWLATSLVLAVLASLVTGYSSWQRLGTYADPQTLAAWAAVLFGFAAREPTRLRILPRALFAGALAYLLVAS